MKQKILLVEKSENNLRTIRDYCRKEEIPCVVVADSDAALSLIDTDQNIGIVLFSCDKETEDGLEFLHICQCNHPEMHVVFIASTIQHAMLVRAIRNGVFDFLKSPVSLDELTIVLARVKKRLNDRAFQNNAVNYINKIHVELVFHPAYGCIDLMRQAVNDFLSHYTQINSKLTQNILLALGEAAQNALDHGSLELESSMKDLPGEEEGETMFDSVKRQRFEIPYYKNRKILIQITLEAGILEISVQDQGTGYKVKIREAASGKVYGMGLMLIRNIADSVQFNDTGNKITFRKKLIEPEIPTAVLR
ncbi:MAG: response regulator [Calditrichaeota bacterium]|nr:MAG: response regulator [Calditrichota bacterium]